MTRTPEQKFHRARTRALAVCVAMVLYLGIGAALGDSAAHSNLNTLVISTIGAYVMLCGRTRGPKGDTGPPGPQGPPGPIGAMGSPGAPGQAVSARPAPRKRRFLGFPLAG